MTTQTIRRLTPPALALIAIGALLSGCATVGEKPFHETDLASDLSRQTLTRYEAEWKALQASGQGHGMARLEHTNWWPLGLVIYWHKGSVMRTESPAGPLYMVSSSEGFGPLSILYVTQTHATFDAAGRRLSGMTVQNVLLGHLAMIHQSDTVPAHGRREEMTTMHLLHHLFNVHEMEGHTEVSLFTAPNPAGVEFHSDHAAHTGHSPAYAAPETAHQH